MAGRAEKPSLTSGAGVGSPRGRLELSHSTAVSGQSALRWPLASNREDIKAAILLKAWARKAQNVISLTIYWAKQVTGHSLDTKGGGSRLRALSGGAALVDREERWPEPHLCLRWSSYTINSRL